LFCFYFSNFSFSLVLCWLKWSLVPVEVDACP
jgi:hypothetical protein